MSNYTVATNFGAKDALASGNPAKLVLGAQLTTEFNNIAAAIMSKIDGTSGGLLFIDGNVGQPSVGFASTAGVGMYLNSGTLELATNGSNRVAISTTGNVVVSAPSSATALTVNALTTQRALQLVMPDSASIGLSVLDGGANNSELRINTNNSEALIQALGTAAQLSLFAASTRKVVITTSGTTVNGSFAMNSQTPYAGSAGWGTPTSATVVANFSGTAATTLQIQGAIAAIIGALKNLGVLQA